MKILGLEITRRKKKNDEVKAPIQEASKTSKKKPVGRTLDIVKIPRIKSPALDFKSRTGTSEFEQPEYDLAEIGRIIDVEGYAQRAFTLKEGLMFKEGWEFVGKNLKTINYIRERLRQMDQATGLSHKLLLRQLGSDLIQYSNAYLVKVRKTKASGGKTRRVPGKKKALEPVAGYFLLPVSTVRFKRDDHGTILSYRQQLPSGKYIDFPADRVIHLYYRRKKGFLIGTPSLVSVKDDIRALRRIEENIELLVYQHLFPLYHYQVGTEKAPAREYPDGTTEIDVVKAEIELLPAEGAIVTPERHKIDAVGAQGKALRAESYLEHFKKRVFAGLGVSGVDMGEGATSNRNTADAMSRNLVDDVKAFQDVFEIFVNECVIKELLLESAFENPLSEENLVELNFHEIDLDAKIKVENHAINAFQGYALTHTELRRRFGREPLSDKEWEDTFWEIIEQPKALIAAMDETYTSSGAIAKNENLAIEQEDIDAGRAQREKEAKLAAQAKAAGSKKKPGPKSTKKNSGQRAAAAKDQPSNQHGKKLSPEKRKSSYISDMVAPNNVITKLYKDLEDDILRTIATDGYTNEWMRALTNAAGTVMGERLLRLTRIDFRNSFRAAGADVTADDLAYPFSVLEARIARVIHNFVMAIVSEVDKRIGPHDESSEIKAKVTSIFDVLRFRSRFIYNTERKKAYNYGAALSLKKQGYTEARILKQLDACEICLAKPDTISLDNIIMSELPCWHPNCTCQVVVLTPE